MAEPEILSPPPDIASAEGKAAYRRELLGVARGWRYAGLALVTVALGLFLYPQSSGRTMIAGVGAETLGWMVMLAGWAFMIMGIVQRTAYHRRRMRGQ